MQLGDQLRLPALELGQQHVAKEIVVAIPLAVVVERDHEHVRLLEGREHLRRVGPAEHGVAERPRHPIENRRASEELDLLRFQVRELLHAQVLGDEAVVAGELIRPLRALRCLEREGGEIEPGRPALGPFVESVRLDVRHVHTRVREQGARLGVGEREICGTDLQKLTSRAIACQRKRGLSAAREHEQRARWDVQGKGVDGVE